MAKQVTTRKKPPSKKLKKVGSSAISKQIILSQLNLEDFFDQEETLISATKNSTFVGLNDKLLQGNTLLWHAVEKGNVAVIAALLHAGADPNVMNDEGISLLTHAVKKYCQPIFSRPGLTGINNEGIHPVLVDILKLLIAYGADIENAQYDESTKLNDYLVEKKIYFHHLAINCLRKELLTGTQSTKIAKQIDRQLVQHPPQNFVDYLIDFQKKMHTVISYTKIDEIFNSRLSTVEKVKQAFNYYHGLSVGKFTLSFSSRFWPKVHCHHHKKTVAALLQKLDSAQTVADCQQVIRHAMAEAKKDAHYNSTGTFALLCAQVLTNLGKIAQQELQAGVYRSFN